MKPVKIKKSLIFFISSVVSFNSYCQADTLVVDSLPKIEHPTNTVPVPSDKQQVYRLKPAIDVPLSLGTAGWSIYGFTQIYSKDGSTLEEIESLNKEDINRFDRWAADVYHEKAADASDFIFYGAMPLPLILLADQKIRKDFGKISFLYFESMSITGLFYTGAAYLKDRYRPYTYNDAASMGDKQDGNAKNSFFAGHVALVATSTFFTAKVFSDYHPESKIKWLFYGGAVAATGATAYLRHRGGRHFPTDILIGLAQGTLTGILVPHFHKNKQIKNSGLTIVPFTGSSHGLSLIYRL